MFFSELNRFTALHFGRHFSPWNDGFNLSNHKSVFFCFAGTSMSRKNEEVNEAKKTGNYAELVNE